MSAAAVDTARVPVTRLHQEILNCLQPKANLPAAVDELIAIASVRTDSKGKRTNS